MGAGLKRVAFRMKCERVAEKTGFGVSFYEDDDTDRANMDDGTLHITRSGLRACFDVANDEAVYQNANIRKVCAAMGLKAKDEYMEDEEEEHEGVCPHCGRF